MFYREDRSDSFDSLPFREQTSSDECMSVDIDSIGRSKVMLREAASSALRLRYDVAKSTEGFADVFCVLSNDLRRLCIDQPLLSM